MDTQQAELELSLIRKLMEDSRKTAIDNGKQYIFWGVLVSIALTANYIMALNRVPMKFAGYMWLILMSAGAIISIYLGYKHKKNRTVSTFAGKILSALWMSAGITMFIIGFVGPFAKAYNPIYISPLISMILAIAFFTSGLIQNIKWLKLLSLGWWVGGIFMFIFPSVHTLLINALMLIFLQTIPGIILYRQWSRENSSVQ